jgi:hypothetical protein
MTLRIKNWSQFQHFKDRRPPWIKLYREILDDIEWHELDPQAAKVLVMLWLIASESEGNLPDTKKLAFRLRLSESRTSDLLSKLSHWLEQVDIKAISDGHQDDAPETEAEKRQREIREEAEAQAALKKEAAEKREREFFDFYEAYPKKEGKKDAQAAWASVVAPLQLLLDAVAAKAKTPDWQKESGKYIPLPATWLRGKRWEDQGTAVAVAAPVVAFTPEPSFTPEQLAANRERMAREFAKINLPKGAH